MVLHTCLWYIPNLGYPTYVEGPGGARMDRSRVGLLVRAISFGPFFSATPALRQDAWRGVSDSMVVIRPGVNKVPMAP